MFQSTHPRGVRHALQRPPFAQTRFNPRTREGCDRYHWIFCNDFRSFNPRTREGCDHRTMMPNQDSSSFNPRTR